MRKNKLILITAIAVSTFGDIILDMFIAWELSQSTGKLMNAVYVIGTSVAFRAALSFFVGSFVDRHPKKRIMTFSYISSIVVIGCLGIFWKLAVQSVIIGAAFVLLNDINNELFIRSYISMTSDMLDENHYIKFQSYSSIVTRSVSIGGGALAGVLISSVSGYAVFIIDILTYIVALLLIQQVAYTENIKESPVVPNFLDRLVSDLKYTSSAIFKSSYLSAFVMLMFILNLAYGYIPQILPIFKADAVNSAVLLGILKSSITIGEVIGLMIVSKVSRYVSISFKVSMVLNIAIISFIYLIQNPYILSAFFMLYGISDSLTQPLFGYTVSNLDSQNRGKLLGGIDAIIMFSPSIGIYVLSAISEYSKVIGGGVICGIFLAGFLIVSFNRKMKDIVLDDEYNMR